MDNQAWVQDLNRLVARFSPLGLCADTSDMEITQQWGVYCSLRRLLGCRHAEPVVGGDDE